MRRYRVWPYSEAGRLIGWALQVKNFLRWRNVCFSDSLWAVQRIKGVYERIEEEAVPIRGWAARQRASESERGGDTQQ